MTTRTDIVVDFKRSPRIAEIAVGSVEIIQQDYVDTIRVIESSFTAMSHPYLLNAEGKAVLGVGKLTGITSTEQDLKLAFNPDTTPGETGTVTTGSSAPTKSGEITFIDTAATFITNGVERGSMVINFTDQSIADVVEVISEISLTTKTLVNGIGNTFDISDVYHVYNITQVVVTGGNLVGVDAVGDPANAVLPTAFTQVINESDTSAALLESGVSGLTPTESAQLTAIDLHSVEMWRLLGLEVGNTVTVTPTGIVDQAGNIVVDFTGDGIATTTMARQP